MKNLYICIIATDKYNEYLPYFFGTLKFLKLKLFDIHPIVISNKKYFDYQYYPVAHLPYSFVSYLKPLFVKNALEYYNCDNDDYMMLVDADTMIRKLDNYDFFENYLLSDKVIFSISPWSKHENYAYENSLCKDEYKEVYIDNIQPNDFIQSSFCAGKINSFYNFCKDYFDLCQELSKDYIHKRIPPMSDQSIITKLIYDNKELYIKDFFVVNDYVNYKLENIENIKEYKYYCDDSFRLPNYNTVFLIQKFNQYIKKPIRYSNIF